LAALRAGARLAAFLAGARLATVLRTVRLAAFLADTRLVLVVAMASDLSLSWTGLPPAPPAETASGSGACRTAYLTVCFAALLAACLAGDRPTAFRVDLMRTRCEASAPLASCAPCSLIDVALLIESM